LVWQIRLEDLPAMTPSFAGVPRPQPRDPKDPLGPPMPPIVEPEPDDPLDPPPQPNPDENNPPIVVGPPGAMR